jgi:hypothetical protein
MDTPFYVDTREPVIIVPPLAVTLAATAKALYTTAAFPGPLGQYFLRPGKKFRIRLFGQITTAATPGNGVFDIYWGTGADANGVILASSAALTLIASQTNAAWQLDITVTCRTQGATGTLFCDGACDFTPSVNAAGGGLIPATAPVVSASVDLTAANIISCQFRRSGSTAETIQVLDGESQALN